jgi:hypothetical protein
VPACAAGLALPVVAAEDPAKLRERVAGAGATERSLSASLERLERAEARRRRQVAALERRRAAVQADLERDRARLAGIQRRLRAQRARALRLRERMAEVRRLLSVRLVERYKAGDVDVISVVLNAASLSDLFERGAFLRRVQARDEQLLVEVRAARRDAVAEKRRLAAAEERRRRAVEGLRARRDAAAEMAAGAAARRSALARVRAARAEALRATRASRRRAERRLRAAERAAAEAAAVRRAASSGTGAGPAPAAPAGGWAIPWPIVQCESGGQNLPPNAAGASGYYQIMPATWKQYGGRGPHAHLAAKAEQDRVAARIWDGGRGASNWVCTDLVA